jgi:hypothetical protein
MCGKQLRILARRPDGRKARRIEAGAIQASQICFPVTSA